MPTVFISNVDEDDDVARAIADAVSARGDTVSQPMIGATGDGARVAIASSDAVVLVISPTSIGSERMADEIAAGAAAGKPFLPVLITLSHAEFAHRAPEWQAAIGAASSVAVPAAGVESVMPRILDGVTALTRPPPPTALGGSRRTPLLVGAAVAAVLIGVGAAVAVSSGGEPASRDDAEPVDLVTTTFEPGPVADSDTTPLATSIGDLRITDAHLTTKVCGTNTDECATASGSERFVMLTLTDVDGKEMTFTSEFRRDLSASYVEFGDQRATYTDATQDFFLDIPRSSVRLAYKFLPASAAGNEVQLAWPGSPTLKFDLR